MEKLTKEYAKKLMAIKGEARGATLLYDWDFASNLEDNGKEAIRKLEDKMAELGFPLKHKEIKAVKFYPIGLDAISVLAIKELFELDEKKLKELGAWEVKFSLFMKIFMKYLISFDSLAKSVPKLWRHHYSVGDLRVIELSEKDKYAILRLENFALHRSFCFTLKGHFSKVLSVALGVPVSCQETKCVFDGDDYHEFLLIWGDKREGGLRYAPAKNLISKMANVKGEARGVVFKTDAAFILKEKGAEGLKNMEEELKSTGHFMEYERIKTMNFYPIGLRILSLIAMQKALGFSEDDIERMGREAPKASFVIKLFGKFFFSITKMVEQAPKMWAKHYTVGDLVAEANEQERYVIIRLRNLDFHPLFCIYLKGYFSTIIQMVVNASVTPEELECSFKGGKRGYHEFLFKW